MPLLKSAICPSPLFSCNLPSILVFRELPPLKFGFLSEPPKYQFLMLNHINLLKVTKFFVKISQFDVLVMTEKNIFVYKLFSAVKYFEF